MHVGFLKGTGEAEKINFVGNNVYYFGDSITHGVNASDSAHRWSTLLSALLGCVEINHGIDGSVLENRSPTNPFGGSNMVSRVASIPVKAVNDALVVFMFGMNDWGYNGVNYTPAHYIADYQTVISECAARGWPGLRILICSPTYPADIAFAFYGGLSGNSNPDRNGMLAFKAAAKSIADTNGALYVDTYTPMLNGGGASLVSGTDGVHPNDSGYAVIANSVYSFLN